MFKLHFQNIVYGILFLLTLLSCTDNPTQNITEVNEFGLPLKPYQFTPNTYDLKTFIIPPNIDGINTEKEWDKIAWSSNFVSEVDGKNHNYSLETKFKMGIYKDTIFLLAKINDPQIWAVDSKLDSIYFKDNFFEIYIDCDNNEYDYLNININALNIIKGRFYRCNDKHINFHDIPIHSATFVDGTVNNPNDTDKYWMAELSFPVNLEGITPNKIYNNGYWKMNFAQSRWQYVIVDGAYKKTINSETGKLYNKDQWLWNYMWENPISNAEFWGEIHLTSNQIDEKTLVRNRRIKWELRNVFYGQKLHHKKHKKYANKIAGLKDIGFDLSKLNYRPDIRINNKHYTATIKDKKSDHIWSINDEGAILCSSTK